MLKYKYIFQIKYTEAILSNSTRKLMLWFEITKMLIQFKKNKFILSFIIIFGTLSFHISLWLFVFSGRIRPQKDDRQRKRRTPCELIIRIQFMQITVKNTTSETTAAMNTAE